MIEEKFSFTQEIQKKIFAMLITEEQTFKNSIELAKPEYFDNLVLKDLMIMLLGFFKKYSRVPTKGEFLEELDSLLSKNERLPSDEYLDVAEEVIELGEEGNFDYISDKLIEFARFQAIKQAITISAKKLETHDYKGIAKLFEEAINIGNNNGQLKCLADIKAEHIKWLWKNRIPEGKLSLIVGDPGIGKSFFTIFMAAHVTTGKPWPDCSAPIEVGKVLMMSA